MVLKAVVLAVPQQLQCFFCSVVFFFSPFFAWSLLKYTVYVQHGPI